MEWLSTLSLAHFFAITRHLEREATRLNLENSQLKQELADLRRESVHKIYQAVGLASSPATFEDAGIPLEMFQQEKQINSTTPITDLVKRAEEESWVVWQEEERRRLANAALISNEFHTI